MPAFRALQARRAGSSVRATAGRLKISPSYWSKILRGEKPLSSPLLPRVTALLRLDNLQVAELQRSILREFETDQLFPSTGLRTLAEDRSPVRDFSHLGESDFWLLDQWYYIPMLNFITLGQDDLSAKGVGRRLGIGPAEASAALRRLTEGGFLEERDGIFRRTGLHARFPTDRSHPAVRKHHRDMIRKGAEALLEETASATFEKRLIAGVSFAGSSEKVKEARLILEEAMYRAASLMAGEPALDEVYQLNLQLFPVSR